MMLRKTVMMATKSVLGGVAVVRVVAAHGDGGTTAVQLEIPANTNIETVDNKIDKTSLNLDIWYQPRPSVNKNNCVWRRLWTSQLSYKMSIPGNQCNYFVQFANILNLLTNKYYWQLSFFPSSLSKFSHFTKLF